tara:strand:- start:518 stop:1042 length:525 start_codon:yes stop_codon:yes gene_type:complete
MQSFFIAFKKEIFPISLILILALSRLIPHPYNFSPMLAVGIFSGFYFRQFYLGLFIVIFSMFIGDLFLGFHSTMFFTYISLAVAVLIGLYVKRFKFNEILFSGLLSSVCFFIITNFGAWLTLEMYEKNFEGLLQSYVMAIPFFHNTLISTFVYLFVLKLLFDLAIRKKIFKVSF